MYAEAGANGDNGGMSDTTSRARARMVGMQNAQHQMHMYMQQQQQQQSQGQQHGQAAVTTETARRGGTCT